MRKYNKDVILHIEVMYKEDKGWILSKKKNGGIYLCFSKSAKMLDTPKSLFNILAYESDKPNRAIQASLNYWMSDNQLYLFELYEKEDKDGLIEFIQSQNLDGLK